MIPTDVSPPESNSGKKTEAREKLQGTMTFKRQADKDEPRKEIKKEEPKRQAVGSRKTREECISNDWQKGKHY